MYIIVLYKNSNNPRNYNNVSFYKYRSVQNFQSRFEIYLKAPFIWSRVTMHIYYARNWKAETRGTWYHA